MQKSAIDFLTVPQIVEIEKKLKKHHGDKKLCVEYKVPIYIIEQIKMNMFVIHPPQLRRDPSVKIDHQQREVLNPEEFLLSSRFYGSSNHKSNTKLIKGWELFTYID